MQPPAFENWLAHGCGIKVDTAHELFVAISKIALLGPDRTFAWRGQRNAEWPFSASLFRRLQDRSGEITEGQLKGAEYEILEEAHNWGLGRDLGISATHLHILALLQHHGVPTRLFDVTANPMTALWFATEEAPPNQCHPEQETAGVLFAIDVTDTKWYETFSYKETTWLQMMHPLEALYLRALEESAEENRMFRVFPALPDERMKAQEGFFLGSVVPERHAVPGILGLNPIDSLPGPDELEKLRSDSAADGPSSVPFCAIVIPAEVKASLRGPLKHTYNRRRRVLFPDIDGFRDGYLRGQLD